jgi:hypothetical protein
MKMPGGFPDIDKKRVVEIVLKHQIYCHVVKASVYCVDEHCFAWRPEKSPRLV